MMNQGNAIKIVIIDDHQLFREGVKRILDLEPEFEVVAEGDEGSQAVSLVEEYHPDVVLMDINMPGVGGIEATRTLLKVYPETKILILSIHDDESYVAHSLRSGAKGYLLKEMDANSLINAVKIVAKGGAYIHPKVTGNIIEEYRRFAQEKAEGNMNNNQKEVIRPLHILTKRECEVLQLLADGKSNRGIGDALFISEKTVKNHVSNILQKMSVKDRTQAVIEAIKKGWVSVN